MAYLARFGPHRAIFATGEWRSANSALEASLNAATREYLQSTERPSIFAKDQERLVAETIIGTFGGSVQLRLARRKKELFLAHRQMTLF